MDKIERAREALKLAEDYINDGSLLPQDMNHPYFILSAKITEALSALEPVKQSLTYDKGEDITVKNLVKRILNNYTRKFEYIKRRGASEEVSEESEKAIIRFYNRRHAKQCAECKGKVSEQEIRQSILSIVLHEPYRNEEIVQAVMKTLNSRTEIQTATRHEKRSPGLMDVDDIIRDCKNCRFNGQQMIYPGDCTSCTPCGDETLLRNWQPIPIEQLTDAENQGAGR
jgi:hypothetical protein